MLGGCAEPVLRPEIGRAAASLISRMGYEVVVAPNAGCCGALVHHLGQEAAALASARRNVDAWMAQIEGAGLEAIIVTASGCGTTIKDYGFMLRSDPAYGAKAERVSSLAMDISEFVAAKGLPPVTRTLGLIVAYQSACSCNMAKRSRARRKTYCQRRAIRSGNRRRRTCAVARRGPIISFSP